MPTECSCGHPDRAGFTHMRDGTPCYTHLPVMVRYNVTPRGQSVAALPDHVRDEMIEYLQEHTRDAEGQPLTRELATEFVDSLFDMLLW